MTTTRTLSLLLGLFLLASVFFMPGCSVYESMNQQKALIQQLEQEKSALQKQAVQVDAAATEADKQAKELQQRESTLRQSMAQVSQQMASATGTTYNTLETILKGMQDQRRALVDQADAAAAQAAQYTGLQAQMAAQIKLTDDALADGQSKIDAMQSSIQSQAQGVGGLIRQVGDALQSYGVPGATPAADTVAGMWGSLASILFGVAGAGGTVLYRNKAKDANQQAAENKQAGQEIAESLQMARLNDPKFNAAFEEAKPTLRAYQKGTKAKAIVQDAKAAIPA